MTRPPPTVLGIGIFDGVHRGHQAILKKTAEIAQRLRARPAILTFPVHPSRVLCPQRPVPLLQTFRQRAATLRTYGIKHIYPLQFTQSLSRLSPSQFVDRVLFRHWNLRGVVVGRSFRFGRNRSGGILDLRRLLKARGCGIWPVAPVRIGATVIQSTRIRSQLASGRLGMAQRMLGHPVELIGRAVRGAGLGSQTGAPTINLVVANEHLPKFGVYAGWLKRDAGRRPVVMNLGVAPTLRKSRRVLLEVHVLDGKPVRTGRGREWTVELARFLRPEKKFAAMAPLKKAIQKDIARSIQILRKGY